MGAAKSKSDDIVIIPKQIEGWSLICRSCKDRYISSTLKVLYITPKLDMKIIENTTFEGCSASIPSNIKEIMEKVETDLENIFYTNHWTIDYSPSNLYFKSSNDNYYIYATLHLCDYCVNKIDASYKSKLKELGYVYTWENCAVNYPDIV